MPRYIDKSALVAEIDKQKIGYNTDGKHSVEYNTVKKILDILDTLEVKKEATTTDAFIKKACDWLTKHAKKYYFNKERYLGTDELVEDFKLSMEI